MRQILGGMRIFDGARFLERHAVVVEAGEVVAVLPEAEAGTPTQQLSGTLAPAFLDLQVNGGGGLMVGPETDIAALRHICAVHRRLGAAGVLPTLITDTPEVTTQVIGAGLAAAQANVPGFLGLHLEGPHLDPARKGAHDPALIRPMTEADLVQLCAARAALPALMVTLAPASATPEQVARLAQAGVVVSLGHSECSYAEAQRYFAAGARSVTHVFNAMSQLGNREPGLVGAVLAGSCHAGLIADGLHVHPAALRLALAARPTGLFLVSDCMAFAGTEATELNLNGRKVLRHAGRLTLADGTLAGADLTLAQAIGVLVEQVAVAPDRALAMASAVPAELIGQAARYGAIAPGRRAEFVRLDANWRLSGVFFGQDWLG